VDGGGEELFLCEWRRCKTGWRRCKTVSRIDGGDSKLSRLDVVGDVELSYNG